MRAPGTKHHREWLIRLVAEDREQRPRWGWVRWHRALPWEAADRWTVHWADGPWTGEADGAARAKGLSTRAFFVPVMALSAAGALAGVVFIVTKGRVQLPTGPTLSTPRSGADADVSGQLPGQPVAYELRCRSGGDAYRIEKVAAGLRKQPTGDAGYVVLSLQFLASSSPAGIDSAGLPPGTCAWIDRAVNPQEPRVIRFETPALATPDAPHDLRPVTGTFPDEAYLRDPGRYWSFGAFNTNQGFLQATRHGPWNPSSLEGGPE